MQGWKGLLLSNKNTWQTLQIKYNVTMAIDMRNDDNMLYDFYGELLTKRQREILENLIIDDLSYSEISEKYGISRQACFEIVHVSLNKLREYENKLGLIERFKYIEKTTKNLQNYLDENRDNMDSKLLKVINGYLANITDKI